MTGEALRPRIAFHAPMKPPEHPNPSGDRRIARLTLQALEGAGFAPFVASSLRTLEMAGDAAAQAALAAQAQAEAARLVEALRPDPPALWFTYHSYWKAPDLVGPAVCAALRLPYVISEPIHARKRREGPWAGFAVAAERSLAAADLLLWSTARDLPSLQALEGARLAELAPFLDLGPPPAPRGPAAGPLRLLAVAMMRPGDKLASYAALAAALARPEAPDLRLEVIGDGAERGAVETLLAPLGARVRFRGVEPDPLRLRAAMEAADLLVWPGVNEGFGMVYLEAQAAGLPALAEDRPGPRHVLPAPPHGLPLPPPGDAAAYAAVLATLDADRGRLAALRGAARAHAEARHGLEAASARLRELLTPLLRR
ncbi:glycosyltransferase [Albimonas pacifica]|uniref:Glycosyltransferase involved in cell wall bisynthesis n=1 Tax=Albimonas pacifica TaxID=1114924 RepID=A0A1I3EMZ9_9RHOB|nr:glycosyltransferase [Albimonas pacifica]SFI00364.1 Glycosyltransferase involved in cell wall bisynthesis [Albimonas pacifica]